ncbi:MAG: glycosyltransferase, partial [Synergistaceae bacterium]|nr:glycosyltransferase [Synergistaceae bacterium]
MKSKKSLLMATTVPVTLKAFLLPYADSFRELGWKVDCLSRNVSMDEKCASHFDSCYDINWDRTFSISKTADFHSCVKRVRELAHKEIYDIVHVHTPVAAFITRYALKDIRTALGTNVIYTAHGFHFYSGGACLSNFIYRMAEKIAARWTDLMIVMNEEDHEAAFSFLPHERVIKMNGIGLDLEYYSERNIHPEKILELRNSIGLKPSDRLYSFVAEFNPGKCHADVIKALAKTNNDSFHLAFAGTGDLMCEMKELSKKLNVAERVHFIGFQNDIRPLIAASVAMVMPSRREGLPRSVMESMAMRTPVIGADIRGTRDLLKDGCGILIRAENKIDGFAEAMIYCADAANVHEVDKITEFAYNRILNYDIKILVKEHNEIYTKLKSM